MALFIPGATEQDELMSYLVKHCKLTSDQQAYVRKKIDQVYDGAILNFQQMQEKKVAEARKIKKSKPENVSSKDDLHREQEMQWHRDLSQQDQDNIERWAD